jgi:uncharacterized membrane protein YhaH (DUF805 family)
MKMSQYNWNWWFMLTLLVTLIGAMVGMVAKNQSEVLVSNIFMIVGLISFIPCLYIGNKPTKN